jgi:mutator protein MutT
MEPKVIEVAAGLIFRGGKLLLTQRRADSHLGGLWEFPGGKREPHETFQECLRRELREELACEVEVGMLFESVVHPYPEKTVRLEFFLCRWVSGEPQAIECADLKWVDRQGLAQYEFPAADARLIERLEAGEGGW